MIVLTVPDRYRVVGGDPQLGQPGGQTRALGHPRGQHHQLGPVADQLAFQAQPAHF